MLGFLFSTLAGALMSIQGVFNTRLTEKIGINETNIIVQGTGFIVAIIVWPFFRTGSFKAVGEVNKLYLVGGIIGVGIIFSVIKGMDNLGQTVAVSAILVAQLTTAALIGHFGWFGTEYGRFGLNKIIGVIAMVIGIIVFKLK